MVNKVTKKEAKDVQSNYDLISYIIGIVAIVQAFITPAAGLILGIIGLTFSKKTRTELSKKAKNLNLTAIIIGALFLLIVIILTFLNMESYL